MLSCDVTVDFNSLWPRGFGNILGTWELRSRIRGFIVTDGNQIANFETKTTSLRFIWRKWLTDYCKNSCTMADNPFVTQGKAIPNQARGG